MPEAATDTAVRQSRPDDLTQTVIKDVYEFLKMEGRFAQPGELEDKFPYLVISNQKGLSALMALPEPNNGKRAEFNEMRREMVPVEQRIMAPGRSQLPSPRRIFQKTMAGSNPPRYQLTVEGTERANECYHYDREATYRDMLRTETRIAFTEATFRHLADHWKIRKWMAKLGLVEWKKGYGVVASALNASDISSGFRDEVQHAEARDELVSIVADAVDAADSRVDEDEYERDRDRESLDSA